MNSDDSSNFKAQIGLAEMKKNLLKTKSLMEASLIENKENDEKTLSVLNCIDQLLNELNAVQPGQLPTNQQQARISMLLIMMGTLLPS